MNRPTFLEESPLWVDHFTDRDLALPDIVQLELTAACDLSCVMCPLPHETRFGTGAERFDVADLERERALFTAASGVELTGFGEILCHPHLLDCLRWFRQMNLSIQATTNGNRLSPGLSKCIVRENLIDVLCISIDAATAETYAQIRRGGDFARLRKNLDALARTRVKRPLRLWLSFAAMEPNIHELPAFIRWAAELGAERVIVQHIFEAPHTQGWGLHHHLDKARSFLNEAGAVADELDVLLDGRNLPEQGKSGHIEGMIKDCPFPWQHTFLKANRRIAACAMVWEDLDFGMLDNGFADVWQGDAYTDFRRRMAGSNPPDPCVRCQYFGWRKPTPVDDIPTEVTMDESQRGMLGRGWQSIDVDSSHRPFRWTGQNTSVFLNPRGKPFLEIDAVSHPQAPHLTGEVIVGDQHFPFDSHDFWGVPLRLPVTQLPDHLTHVDIQLRQTWNPGSYLGMPGARKIGLLVYRIGFAGEANDLQPIVKADDPNNQLGQGWLAAENVGGRTARWAREKASLLLGESASTLVVETLVPQGLDARTVEVFVNEKSLGKREIDGNSQWRLLSFSVNESVQPPAVVELVTSGAAPAPNDTSPHPRRFGIIVSRIGFMD